MTMRVGLVLLGTTIREEERRLARVVRFLAKAQRHTCFVVGPSRLLVEMKENGLLDDAAEMYTMAPIPRGGFIVSFRQWRSALGAALERAEAVAPVDVLHHSNPISWLMVSPRQQRSSLLEAVHMDQRTWPREIACRLARRAGTAITATNVPTWGLHLENLYDQAGQRG